MGRPVTQSKKQSMSHNSITDQPQASYSYHRSHDGCDDVFIIENADGQSVLEIHFWDDPHTTAVAEAQVQMLVAALNLPGGGWAYPQRSIRLDGQTSSGWGIEDVRQACPDLSEELAWEVVRRAEMFHDHEITPDTLRKTADELFPVRYRLDY